MGADDGGLPCSMPGRLRDVGGNAMPVQFYYSSFQDICSNCTGYILGIREDDLEQRLPPMENRNARGSSQRSNSDNHGAGAASDGHSRGEGCDVVGAQSS